jgi:hypothetical protein
MKIIEDCEMNGMFALIGTIFLGAGVWILSMPAGAATVGEVRGIAGACGLLIGVGVSLIGVEVMRHYMPTI